MSAHTESQASRQIISRIRAAWRGEATLAWVFWGFSLGGGILLWVIGAFGFLFLLPFTVSEDQSVLASPIFRSYLIALVLVYLAYVVASVVMVWRCSFNVANRIWGYVARILVVIWVLRVLLLLRILVVA